jgi:hypothetical protein
VITESFMTQIEDAILDRLTDAMGPGGVYEDPPYLQVQHTLRATGEPVPQIPEADTPALWVEYIAGMVEDRAIGSAFPFARETFTIFGRLIFTPEIVGYGQRDEQVFRKIADASKDTFCRRMRKLLTGWSPGVQCPVTGEKASSLRVDLWAAPAIKIGDFKFSYHIVMRCLVTTEP